MRWWMRVTLHKGGCFSHSERNQEEMGIAVELRGPTNLREGRTEVGEEAAYGRLILNNRARPQGERERLDLRFEDLFERGWRGLHERCSDPNFLRFSMARAYSRQTSRGA